MMSACVALVPLTACAAQQPASEPQATSAEIVTDTGRWETEGSRDTLVRLEGPVGGWTASRR